MVSHYPLWMYLLCFVLGALYAYILYKKDKRLTEFTKSIIRVLVVLRILSVAFIAALLLAPLVKYLSKNIEPPILILAQDYSSSMTMIADSSFYLNDFEENLSDFKKEMNQTFKVDHFYFAGDFKSADSSIVYNGKMTDYQQLFQQIENRYINRNVGAVVLISDGIYNRGSNPLYLNNTNKFPLYSIAMGDTTVRRDVKIDRLRHNEIAYLDNKFPLEVSLSFDQAKGEETQLQLYKNDNLIYEKAYTIHENNEHHIASIQLKAEEVGLQKYEVVLTPIKEELNVLNNKKVFYIDVLDSRQKVLLLYDAPHPDIGAIHEVLNSSKSYEVKLQKAREFEGDFNNFNLVILYQLPSNNFSANSILNQLSESKVAVWYILGLQSNYAVLHNLDLPFKVEVNPQDFSDVYPLYNSAFPLFTLSDNALNVLKNLPPLRSPFGKYKMQGSSQLLLWQKLGNVETEYPLFLFSEFKDKKNAVFIGEGIWRWRLANFANNENHEGIDELITKTVQYLSLKADRSYFRIAHERQFLENEAIIFDAQLYNESYELVNEVEVKLDIQDLDGKLYNYAFNKLGDAYHLEISSLPIGSYTYVARTTFGANKYEKKGEFTVEELQLEAADLVANHNLLYQLSVNSDAEVFYPRELDKLANALNQREDISSISYHEEEVQEVINLPWIFYILLFLLSLEWFIRKRNGAY